MLLVIYALKYDAKELAVGQEEVIVHGVNKLREFKSTNSEVATVDQNGNVKALKEGKAIITFKDNNGRVWQCQITVVDNAKTAFYSITSPVERENDRTYSVCVENEEGEEVLIFANKTLGESLYKRGEELIGSFTIVTLNGDGEIESLKDYDNSNEFIVNANTKNDMGIFVSPKPLKINRQGDVYKIIPFSKARYDEDNKILSDNNYVMNIKVNSNTVGVNLIFDNKGTENILDDEYRVDFCDADVLCERLNDDKAIALIDESSSLKKAEYVIVFSEILTKNDNLFGIVADVSENAIGEYLVTVSETRITNNKELKEAKKDAMILNGGITGDELRDNYQVIMYSKEENKNEEYELTFITGIRNEEFVFSSKEELSLYYAGEDISRNGRIAMLELGDGSTKTIEFNVDNYDNCTFVIVMVNFDDEDLTETKYVAEEIFELDCEDVSLEEFDRILIDDENEVIFIIRGMEER